MINNNSHLRSCNIQTLGYVPYSQTKIDFYDEANYELSKAELNEAVNLSGYTKKEKLQVYTEIENKPLTNTGRMWQAALDGVWKTMIDVDGWKLPATFDSYNICGKGYFKICPTDGYVRRFVYHCGRMGCEKCAKRAGSRMAKKIERRIWLYGLRVRSLSDGKNNPLSSHVIEAIDPASEFWNYSKVKQTSTLKKTRKLAGITGGAEINHLWRFDKSDLSPRYSPHKHLIAYGWIKENAYEIIQNELGLKINYIKVKNGTLKNRVDVFATAYYQLSHCAVKQNKHSIKWFGNLSYSKISNKILYKYKDEEYRQQDDDIERTKHCPICMEKLIPAKINILFDNWKRWIPPISSLDEGCTFERDVFVSVDYNKKEKIPYYDENYQVFYKQTNKEREELTKLNRPDLYDKKTTNQSIVSFSSGLRRIRPRDKLTMTCELREGGLLGVGST